MTEWRANALAPLALDLLNSLGAHIAVMDSQCRIVAVNKAWMRFARENGAEANASPVGKSYVDACESACRAGDESATAMVQGIRRLLGGEGERFSVEYPCHSPTTKRWFLAEVTRFSHAGATYLAAVHQDITARKLAEEALQETETTLLEANRAVDAANRELQAVLEREQVKARTDDLTGINNRRHFFELAGQLYSVAQRYRSPFSIVMFDIDFFKGVNDRYGHQAGDAILQCVARVAREQLRGADVLARYGGEEFIVALPATTGEEAFAVAEKLRESIPACGRVASADAVVNISAGVAQMASVEESLENLIRRADDALYQAKNEGRNRSKVMLPGV